MKKFLASLLLLWPIASFAQDGTVLVIDKIAPKNGAFVGVVDASQTVTNTANFNHNLSTNDTTVQLALDTIDELSVSSTAITSISTNTTGAGSFIWNFSSLQPGAPKFNVASGTVQGILTVTGQLFVDSATLSGASGNLSFDPTTSIPNLVLNTTDLTGQDSRWSGTYRGVTQGYESFGNATNGVWKLTISSDSIATPTIRLQAAKNNSLFQVNNATGGVYFAISTGTFRHTMLNCSGNTNSGKLTADGTGNITCADDASGSGGASALAIATGSATTFLSPVSSPTAVINFDSTYFIASLKANATAYITVQNLVTVSSANGNFLTQSSATATYLQNVSTAAGMVWIANSAGTFTRSFITAGTNITITTGSGNLTIDAASSSGGGGSPIAVATGSATTFLSPVSSPTLVINFDNTYFTAALKGSATSFISITTNVITASSITATYVQISSANGNFLTQSSATATYLQNVSTSAGMVWIANSGGTFTRSFITAGSNVTITTGSGNLTIAASSSGGSSATSTTTFGMIYTSAPASVQANISTTAIQLTGFTISGPSSNTTISGSSITVLNGGTFLVGASFIILTTNTIATTYLTYEFRVNGSTTNVLRQSIGAGGNSMAEETINLAGLLTVSANDIITIFVKNSTTTTQTIQIESGQFFVAAAGGTSGTSSSGGSSGVGSSSLAVSTGTASTFLQPTSSPTAVLNFDSTYFTSQLTGAATAFISVQGLLTNSSATSTYLQGSSATATYFNKAARLPNSNMTFTQVFYPDSAKFLVPGTTNFPKLDNSTTAAVSSLYFDSITTQTVVWSTILAPYGGGALSADFLFGTSTVTSGNVGWGTTISCDGPENSVLIDNQFGNWTLDQSTGGAIPGTAGYVGKLTSASISLHTCVENDIMSVLVTRYHGVSSDAAGDVGLKRMRIHEN